MSQPADVPRQPGPAPRTDVVIVQQADEDLQAYVRRLRDQNLHAEAERVRVNVTDALDGLTKGQQRRKAVSEELDKATRANNQPTTSQTKEPRRKTRKQNR